MVKLGRRAIGGGAPCFVIAEGGVNHNGDVDLAERLVGAAADAGADAVKFQTFRAEGVAAEDAPKADYQLDTTSSAQSQLEMLRALELDGPAHARLKGAAEERGLTFLSTPFDRESVDLLDGLGIEAFKIASPDITNVQLLADVGSRRRPVILSTGTADLEEVELAVAVLRQSGAEEIVVLHCVTAYPAPARDANLRAIGTMAERLGVPIGYSDHTEGDEVALAAVALGACVVEKHFTIDRSLPGPDQRSSLEPSELAEFVRRLRRVEAALGDGVKRPAASERGNSAVVRRSLAAADDLPAGAVLTRGMLKALRPGSGIAPTRIDEVVGRRLRREVAMNQLLDPDDLE